MKKILFLIFAFISLLSAAVNINTASKEELQTLKGIGETKAEAILEYRKDQNFTSIEDIKKVKGIGEKTFEEIKDSISVE
ncbi:ComEA family DNA-binding protein [Campylobacter cuniculorum]|uniref:Competence protein, ComEA family n=2 Tax=Campylobacter cuniculorum TaxID=374106 RepID=A0A1W6BUE7_9BACT|nr:helix-hairpin-helix domain-containing protein [Campylobacter cuniculorum]ARJ55705.1 competence protein, ComEA family [Campylobacter cuniculorum DSM 23162 = LMG 24588]QOR04924.1 helix-hairpin-helix domain-containing protein [Campylobacter cuniculorum]